MKFTGIRDTDILILNELNDNEIGKVYQINKYFKYLCDDENFWSNRLMRTYNSVNDIPVLSSTLTSDELFLMKKCLLFNSNKDLYIWLKKEKLDRYKIPFNRFKSDLVFNEPFQKIIEILSKTSNIPSWVNKDEFLIYVKRLLFRVFGTVEIALNKPDSLTDDIYKLLLNRDFGLSNINEIIRDIYL